MNFVHNMDNNLMTSLNTIASEISIFIAQFVNIDESWNYLARKNSLTEDKKFYLYDEKHMLLIYNK